MSLLGVILSFFFFFFTRKFHTHKKNKKHETLNKRLSLRRFYEHKKHKKYETLNKRLSLRCIKTLNKRLPSS